MRQKIFFFRAPKPRLRASRGVHSWLGAWLAPLALLHMLAALLFALLHAPSVHAMWALRAESDPARVGTLLDRSRRASAGSWIAFALLALTGTLLAAAQHAWARPWAWGSAIALVAVSLPMSLLAARPFNHARDALGLRWFDGTRVREPTGRVDAEALAAALRSIRARAPATTALGAAGLAAIGWLMVVRPG